MNDEIVDLEDEFVQSVITYDRLRLDSVKEVENSLITAQNAIIASVLGNDITSNKRNLKKVLSQIDIEFQISFSSLPKILISELQDISKVDFNRTVRALNTHSKMLELGTIDHFDKQSKKLQKKVMDKDFLVVAVSENDHRFLEDLLKDQTQFTIKKTRRAIAQGVKLGWSNQEIESKVRKITKQSINQTRALVRTAVSASNDQVRNETFKLFDNIGMKARYRWVSVLDGRTTIGCRFLDGRVAERRDDLDKIPRHFNCRSVVIPITDISEQVQGTRPYVIHNKHTVNHRDGTKSTKFTVKKTGQVPSSMTQDDWFNKQSKEFKIDTLGKGKYKLFQEKKLKFSDLVDRNYKDLSLKDLKERYS